MKMKMLGLVSLICIMSFGQMAHAQTKRLFILDATGSMISTHEGEDGTDDSTRFEVALKKMVEEARIGLEFNEIMDMLQVSVVLFSSRFGVENNYMETVLGFDYWRESDLNNLLTADGKPNLVDYPQLYPSGSTPLADAACYAIDVLEGETADAKEFFVYTDGDENWSAGKCSASVAFTKEFSAVTHEPDDEDEVYADWTWTEALFKDQGAEKDERERTWISQFFWGKGRYYGQSYVNNADTAENRDWAGGVEPGSWPWKVYYRIGSDEDLESPSDDIYDSTLSDPWHNRPWNPDETGNTGAVGRQDIVGNVAVFYEDIDAPLATSSRSLFSVTNSPRVERRSEAGAPKMALAISASKATTRSLIKYSLLDSKEMAFFSALATMTNGEIETVKDSEAIYTKGDINEDGVIDETDLRLVLTWFGQSVNRYCPESAAADLYKNGFVDNMDVSSIRANWTDKSKDAPYKGDTDYNWCVDGSDLNLVMQWYSLPVDPASQQSYHADINADGFVDDADVAIVEANMEMGCVNQPSCNDGVKNNSETDVDCGGPVCRNACAVGQNCVEDLDCQSEQCEYNHCLATTSNDFEAEIVVNNQYTGGYCANLVITNNGKKDAVSWNVVLETNGGVISGSWNAEFVGNTGTVNVNPLSWNVEVPAGQSINSPGFCATVDSGDAFAEVVSATAVYE